MTFTYGGFRQEPDLEKIHWNFDGLKQSLTYQSLESDLRCFSLARHDQSHSGSCVAQSMVKALEIKRVQKFTNDSMSYGNSLVDALAYGKSKHIDLSRLALYYLSREMMKPSEVDKDGGTYISTAADVLRRFGVCRENPVDDNDVSYWPFNLDLIYKSPSWMAMRQAYQHKISSWYKIYSTGNDRVDDVILSLASGNPVVFGTKIYDNWGYYDGTPLNVGTGSPLGGHATVLLGWDPKNEFFWDENSWGNSWGPDDGFCKLTPEVISSSQSSDFIVIIDGVTT